MTNKEALALALGVQCRVYEPGRPGNTTVAEERNYHKNVDTNKYLKK